MAMIFEENYVEWMALNNGNFNILSSRRSKLNTDFVFLIVQLQEMKKFVHIKQIILQTEVI